MKVENRKLFSNRDARSKLANMGGIMTSSPELMGEAQRFANGDEVVVPKFIINIPGLVPAGRFLQIDASTLQMLQETIPDLMTQENVLIEEATPALLDQINPYSLIESGDREVVDRLQDMGVEAPQSEAEGPGIMDRVSSLFGFGGDDSAAFVPRFLGDTQFQQDMVARDATPPAAVAGIGTLGDVTEAFGPGNTFTSGRELASAEGESLLSSVGNTMRSNPLRDAIAAGRVTMANTRAEEAEEQKQAEITESEQLLAAQDQQRDAQRMMEINATPPAMSPDGYQIITNRSGAPQSVNQRRIDPDKIAKITERFANGEITEAQYQGQKKEYENAVLQDNAHKAYSAEQQAVTDAATAKDDAAQAAIFEATLDSRIAEAERINDTALVEALLKTKTKKTPQEFRDQEEDRVNAQGGLNSMRLEDSKDIRALAAAEDSKNINPQGPNFVIPDVTAEIGKGDGADDSDDAGAAGTGKTLFAPSTVKDYQKMYADMLGGKDKDSAKDKWNDFAMIGFAIAAGQDPSALTNIAQGLLDGTKMMKEDRSIEQARQDKINMMAIQSAEQDRRTALAAGASVTAANLAYDRQLDLATTKFDRDKITAANLAATNLEKATATASSKSTAADRLYEGAFDSAMAAFQTAIGNETMTAEQAAARAIAIADKSFPDASQASGNPPPLTQQETEAVAKAAGKKTFVYQGEIFEVR